MRFWSKEIFLDHSLRLLTIKLHDVYIVQPQEVNKNLQNFKRQNNVKTKVHINLAQNPHNPSIVTNYLQ